MTIYFTGAAAGSALATIAWVHWRWNGVCVLALGLIALAGIVHAMGHRGTGDHCRATTEDIFMEA
jgi:predicted MFS family arabinose efflux permease